jgi:hypothetical protein
MYAQNRRTFNLAIQLLLISLANAGWPCRATAQAPSPAEKEQLLQQSRQAAKTFIETIRPKLFSGLPTNERIVYDRIAFKVGTEEGGWSAYGGIDQDRDRFVDIDDGYYRQIDLMTGGFIIEQRRNQDFLVPYVRYVVSQLQKQATFIQSPYTFAGMSMADVDALDSDSDFKLQHAAMITNSMAFVLAHEVGHHVLGHYDRPIPDDNQSRQALERAADDWAIKRMAYTHFSPLGGLPPILFDFYFSPLAGPSQSHPAPIERVHALFIAMRNALPEFRSEIESKGVSFSAFSAAIDRQLADAERQLRSMPDTAASGGGNNGGAGNNSFCSAVKNVVAAGDSRFRTLQLEREDAESFSAPILIPGADRCTVWHYRDHRLGSAAVCEFGRSDSESQLNASFEQIGTALQQCLAGWDARGSDRSTQRQVEYSGSDSNTGVRLRVAHLRSRDQYMIQLWFERE